jgi:hypothetical protein
MASLNQVPFMPGILLAFYSQVDRGSGWSVLAFDTTPLPATPAKWKHRTIYRVGDHQVGVWSNTVEIMTGG